ncbi:MAG TPA: gamma-glutamyl-gamma-aminobutyrate hydrolase family protein [Acidimicrobiales bacterium]|jgi:putative glutamine amidotransferase|nr:gamma-glutamyl-gamma-aminobutyrate hydrolase family protein [Acidimicrobiales bacterium]
MTDPPIIGVLCGRSPEERYSTHRGYAASVTAAGGLPVLLPAGPDVDPLSLTTVVAHCQAIVVTGGGDVDPDHYAGPATRSADLLMDVDPARDIAELAVVQFAIAQGKRVLGVCRGAQLLAVMGGGTLIHDLKEKGLDGHWDEERQYEPVHPVQAEPGSLAALVLGPLDRVNSIHHQAIADPGQTLRATAWSPDGVIEAVEAPGLLGVQWHPERLSGSDARYLAPFSWLVQG